MTERDRSEEPLRLALERYARAMEASDEGHWDVNLATGEIFLSPRMKQLFGFPADMRFADRAEFLARAPFHPDDRQRVLDAVRSTITGTVERYELDYRIVPRPGEVRWVRSRGKRFVDERGAPARLSGSLTDITDRKLAEEASRRSEERFALAVAGSNDGVWDWDIPTDQMFMSERAQRIYGLEPGATVRHRAEWRAMITLHPDDVEGQRVAVDDYLAGRAPSYEGEWRVRHADGAYRWVRIRGRCVRDEAGRATRFAGSVSDIDQQKRAEAALRLSEERYERAMLASEAGFWEWTAATDHFYASPRLLEMGGLPPGTRFAGRADSLSRTPFHPEDLARWHEATAALFAGKHNRVEMEMRMIVSGETRWVHLNGLCTRDAAGAVARWTGSMIDITERKQAEAALRLSEERYARAMEAAGEGHWEWNLTTDEMFLSERTKEMLGLAPDERFAGSAEFFARQPVHPEDRERVAEVREAARSGVTSRYEIEYRVVPRPGEVRWIRSRGKLFLDERGAPARMTGSVRDVTDRKLAEEALRRSEARFRSLTELSSDWYWEQDENLRFTYLSPRVNALTGYTAESSIGKKRWELVNLTPLSCSWSEHQAVLAARQPFRDFECSRVGPNGAISYRSISGTPIFDERGRFKGYHGVGRDITERKQAEEALRESEARYARVMEASDHGLWEWDPVADRAFVSPRGCQLFGAPDGMNLTSRAALKAHGGIHPQDVPRIDEAIQACLARRTGGFEIEYRVINPAGELRWIRSRGKFFPDAHGS